MPPKKNVDASKAAGAQATTGDEGTPLKEGGVKDGVNIEDLNLPRSIVTRLAKGVLPANTAIQANAVLAMTKSATVFVNYLASHANENTQRAGRKNIAPQDVIGALEELEIPHFKKTLENELARFVESQTDKRNTYRKKVAADKAAGIEEESFVEDGQPAAKKVRLDGEGEETMIEEEEEEGGEEDQEQEQEQDEEEENEEDDAGDERQGPEEQLEEEMEQNEREGEDEALDNGDDSD